MITYDNVTITRGGKLILQNIDLRLNKGEKAAIVGPSGCGKSSLLLALMGIFEIPAGKITFDNTIVNSLTIKKVRRAIAYIGQEPVMGADSVQQALLLPFQFHANASNLPDKNNIDEALGKVRLDPDILKSPCSVISGGEKQRIAIARALLMRKNVFLADEMTSALDSVSRDAVFDLLSDPAFTVLSVSHDHKWIESCHHVYTIRDKTITQRQGGQSK